MAKIKFDKCRLCLKKNQLQHSHILPEFMYINTYDDKHRAIKVSSVNGAKEIYIQKGEREYLLCQDCETHISKYEGYSANIIKSFPTLQRDHTSELLKLNTPRIDYKKFKLFQMSILWRASIAKSPLFKAVKLGKQEERLRKMLLESKPGLSHNFGCLMVIIQNTKQLKHIIWVPVKDDIEGKICYRFQTGELFWYFFITSHPKEHLIRNSFLSEDGNLPVLIAPWKEEEVIQRIAGLIAQNYSRNE